MIVKSTIAKLVTTRKVACDYCESGENGRVQPVRAVHSEWTDGGGQQHNWTEFACPTHLWLEYPELRGWFRSTLEMQIPPRPAVHGMSVIPLDRV